MNAGRVDLSADLLLICVGWYSSTATFPVPPRASDRSTLRGRSASDVALPRPDEASSRPVTSSVGCPAR